MRYERDTLRLLWRSRAGSLRFCQHLLELPGRCVQRAVVVVDEADAALGDDLLQVQLNQFAPLQGFFLNGDEKIYKEVVPMILKIRESSEKNLVKK